VDLKELRRRRFAVLTLATVGVLASTLLVGGGVWLAAKAVGVDLPLTWSLVFGALISPTDPVAVLAAVRHGHVSERLRAILQGEALFNDGVGIVVFLALVAFATHGDANPGGVALDVLIKAGGGLALGTALGFIAVRLLKAIDEYAVEVCITVALATGVYALAEALHMSGAIAVVAAGLFVGATGMQTAMSDLTQRYVQGFWTLIDEILNALLFFLLGLEMLVVPLDTRYSGLWAVAIPLVVLVRLAIVFPWGAYFHFREAERAPSLVLGWGGLRGALSLALALNIPNVTQRPLILSLTYAVVVFSVAVQGLTFGRLASWASRLTARPLAATSQG
jgi:CPA1 family monovalent cation:H+ antiporter